MLIFWAVAASLLLLAVAVLLRPLLRREAAPFTTTPAMVAVYREQFAELGQDRENGLLDEPQYQQAKSELERRLLEDARDAVPVSGKADGRPERLLAAALLVLLPALAVPIYLKTGNPGAIIAARQPQANPAADGGNVPANIEAILQSLRQKLELDPDDGAGWALLARANTKLHRYDEAVQAFEQAVRTIPDDPQLLVDYAIALAFLNQHSMAGEPEALVTRALELDPGQAKALMLAASAAFDRSDYSRAIDLWERLLHKLPPDSEAAASVNRALDDARRLQAAESPEQLGH
ncbi:c-type cytochrome biogenesis protein CcmI [Methylobacillus sp. Pita1]|uniref:c-type cytochrome biogenesis protein CcmI n=1 Tax=Methylobacillus sp. Pita1 TaxID=3382642 RepID=UPI0038B64C25